MYPYFFRQANPFPLTKDFTVGVCFSSIPGLPQNNPLRDVVELNILFSKNIISPAPYERFLLEELWNNLELHPTHYRPLSESIRDAYDEGLAPVTKNIVEDYNCLASFYTDRSVISYDLDKISGSIELRLGYAWESCWYEPESINRSIKNLPVIADDNGPFGSPCSWLNLYPVTEQTKRMMTIIYSTHRFDKLNKYLDNIKIKQVEYFNATDFEYYIFEGLPNLIKSDIFNIKDNCALICQSSLTK
jgi:hypothetical protein